MIGLKDIFEEADLNQWVNRLKKDLKSEDLHELHHTDSIEEISYISYSHKENSPVSLETPGNFPYTRSNRTDDNSWSNEVTIYVTSADEANKKALDVLMTGADAINFVLMNDTINFDSLMNGIGIEYIKVNFTISAYAQFEIITKTLISKFPNNVSVSIDIHGNSFYKTHFSSISDALKAKQFACLLVDGFKIQQCGASAWQELTFMLSTGHEYLVDLMKKGFSIDEAAACIHFKIGIGANYFIEIAKIRTLRRLWSLIIEQYSPVHACSYNCRITAQTGLLNKSAKDPYTNLLRMTTEALSAVSGGVEKLNIMPYDMHTSTGVSKLSERMAMNISLILKEESYLDKVLDPTGGSYSVESLTNELSNKSWQGFRNMEQNGGIMNVEAFNSLKKSIKNTSEKRLSIIRDNERILIGINKFPNIQTIENEFQSNGEYVDLPFMILERDK